MDESKPLYSVSIPARVVGNDDLEAFTRNLQESIFLVGTVPNVRQRLLLRSGANGTAGLYAYDVLLAASQQNDLVSQKNVRATRLAMACGLFSGCKSWGNVLLVRASIAFRVDLAIHEDGIYRACCISPDLRESIPEQIQNDNNKQQFTVVQVPPWLGNALQQNYHDKAVLSKLAEVMTTAGGDIRVDETDDDDASQSASDSESQSSSVSQPIPTCNDAYSSPSTMSNKTKFVTKRPLCLHCRRPAKTLCPDCKACYFCDTPERQCRTNGWTHESLCATWKLYTDRRKELSTFSFLGRWTEELTADAFHSSEQPYEDYLIHQLRIDAAASDSNTAQATSSWWSTELHGWAGGNSKSARTVDMSARKTYAQGFFPLELIPPQRRVTEEDIQRANASLCLSGADTTRRNAMGLLHLSSWEQYYRLRGIPASSPVALLCTFPLTVYYAIMKYGEVPVTVARMLQRPLRIHLVGVEKEANFLDLFQEVGFLLPEDFKVEMTFVVREDMLPIPCQKAQRNQSTIMTLQLCSNLSLTVVSGTYGASLDPNFDCGSAGPPDMILAMNAGLYAYDSWQSVVTYLYRNVGVLGVFSDYNEYSGINCAGLGGQACRESLCINPFRQPRAMPVYSMNLPQFSNGFLYVMNEQVLE